MVSFAKASSVLFFASSIGARVASAHKVPEDLDMEAFAAKLRKLRADAGYSSHPGANCSRSFAGGAKRPRGSHSKIRGKQGS